MSKIKEKLATLPMCPGVYIMKDIDGHIIYVGKSKVLKNRVSQYFQNSSSHSPKTVSMVEHIADFEYIITDTEAEALALECNLIKKHRPKYNILLKDDKQYPYIKITADESFPRIFMTRRLKKDGGLYFGPFMTALNVKESVEEIRKIFKIRSCNKHISKDKTERPCLYYQIGQCSAPCSGKITEEEYKQSLEGLTRLLNGNYSDIIEELTKKMALAADKLEFEAAAQYRDKIQRIKALEERQKVSTTKDDNMDFISLYQESDNCCIQLFYYRGGKAVGSEYFTLKNPEFAENSVLEGFVKQFYFTQQNIPNRIFISEEIGDKPDIESWLSQLCGHKVRFLVPKQGEKAEIMRMVTKNACESFYKEKMLKNRTESYRNQMLFRLSELLNLKEPPMRIECYDISNFSGKSSVGVQIVYLNGAPAKKLYRKFNIKTVDGADDYKSTQEVLYRRISEAYKEEDLIKNGSLTLDKAKFLPLPELILLDGGKGHVSAVKMLFDTLGEEIPVFGLVKDNSHKTRGITDEASELPLKKNSELFKFLACMQDEVHRFAINASRKKHENKNVRSELEGISGVGKETVKKLLRYFRGIGAVKKAEIAELEALVGKTRATNIYNYFHGENDK